MAGIALPFNISSPALAMSAKAKSHFKKSAKCEYYYYNTDIQEWVRIKSICLDRTVHGIHYRYIVRSPIQRSITEDP